MKYIKKIDFVNEARARKRPIMFDGFIQTRLEILDLCTDLIDSQVRCDVFMGGVNKLILVINLDKNLEMFVDKSDQKIKAFSEYATKIKFVYDQIEEISQRLELMGFAIKGYVFDQSRSNDHFSITLSTIE